MARHGPMDLPSANHLASSIFPEECGVEKSMREYGSTMRQHDLFDTSRLGRTGGEDYK